MVYFITKQVRIPAPGMTVLDSLDKAIEYCYSKKYLGVDVETNGLSPVDKESLLFIIGDKEKQFVIDLGYFNLEPFKELLESFDFVKVLQNAKFDYQFIRNEGISMNNVRDTMLCEEILYTGYQHYERTHGSGLSSLAFKYLKVNMPKDTREDFLKKKRGSVFQDYQVMYAGKDVEHLIDIFIKQLKLIKKNELTTVMELENKAVLALADIEYEGLELDKEMWDENISKLKEELEELELQLDSIIEKDPLFEEFVPETFQGDFFKDNSEVRKLDINWGSPAQKLKIFQKINPSIESTRAEELRSFFKDHELFQVHETFSKKKKLYSAFGKKLYRLIPSDGKVHTSFKQIVSTGRMSSSEPNMQQLPSNPKLDEHGNIVEDEDGTKIYPYRYAFVAPENWVFVSSDYSSQELCVIAEGSQDPVWLNALDNGQDLHSVAAELVYKDKWKNAAEDDCAFYNNNKQKCKCPEHKNLRDDVKSINFGLAYGMGTHGLANKLLIPEKEAKKLMEDYFKAFPAIEKFLNSLGNYGKLNGYIKTFPPISRRRYFPYKKEAYSKKFLWGTIERASKNTPIQGTSADMMKLAMVYIRDYIQKNNYPAKMVMTIHDQIDTITVEEKAEEWKDTVTYFMEKAALKILPSGRLKAETEITKRWSK